MSLEIISIAVKISLFFNEDIPDHVIPAMPPVSVNILNVDLSTVTSLLRLKPLKLNTPIIYFHLPSGKGHQLLLLIQLALNHR